MCLFQGSYYESGPCRKSSAHTFLLYVHAYGGFSMSDGIFLLVFERYASVFYPTFRSSEVYRFWFMILICAHILGVITYLHLMVTVRSTVSAMTALTSLAFLYLITFILVVVLFCLSKKRYYQTLGLMSLANRFMLSESYELSRSTLPAILVALVINMCYCVATWLLVLGYFLQELYFEYFAFGNVVTNFSATIFPILFIYGSRRIRRKILKVTPFRANQVSVHRGVKKLDGHRIELIQTQNEYFDKLKSSWG